MRDRRSAPSRRAGDGGQSAQFARLKKANPGPDGRTIRTVRTPEKGDPRAALRTRLVEMRSEIIAAMVRDGFSAGLGALLAQLAAALDETQKSPAARGNADPLSATKEAETANSAAFPLPAVGPERAVVADDGEAIRLVVYGGARALASVPLDPVRAVGLARDLLAAAHPRLARTILDIVT